MSSKEHKKKIRGKIYFGIVIFVDFESWYKLNFYFV